MRRRWLVNAGVGLAVVLGAAGAAVAVPLVGSSDAPQEPSTQGVRSSVTEGEVAVWQLSDPTVPTVATRSLEIGVERLGCASGVTGEVLEPVVVYETDRIVIEVNVVAERADLDDTCPGKDVVPTVIELAEPVGRRDLVDGACVDAGMAETRACEDPVRLPASEVAASELAALAALLRYASVPDYDPFTSPADMRANSEVAVDGTVVSVTDDATVSPVYNRQKALVTLTVTDDLLGSQESTVVLAIDLPAAFGAGVPETRQRIADTLAPGTRIVVFGYVVTHTSDGPPMTDGDGNGVVAPAYQGLYFVESDGSLVDVYGEGFGNSRSGGIDEVDWLKVEARRG